MKHLVKVCLQNSDMFVSNIENNKITYEIRDKVSGKNLEAIKTSTFTVSEQKIDFDNRFIALPLFNYLNQILN